MKFFEALNSALNFLLKNSNQVILYGEDIVDNYGGAFKVTKGLSTKFPKRVIATPISEASLVGIAGGMSIGGLKPIVEIMFADFILLAADQLLNHLLKYEKMYNQQVKVQVTIRTAVGARRGYGPTHSQSPESILASFPEIKIISPTVYHDVSDILIKCVNDDGVKIFLEYKLNYPKNLITSKNIKDGLYIRKSKSYYETVYLTNFKNQIPDITIISHGGNSILIEDLMYKMMIDYEINIKAILPSLIKPIKFDEIKNELSDSKYIFVIEESIKNNGWGSEVVALLTENKCLENKEIFRIGAKEEVIPSAIKLEEKMLPSVEKLKDKILKLLDKN